MPTSSSKVLLSRCCSPPPSSYINKYVPYNGPSSPSSTSSCSSQSTGIKCIPSVSENIAINSVLCTPIVWHLLFLLLLLVITSSSCVVGKSRHMIDFSVTKYLTQESKIFPSKYHYLVSAVLPLGKTQPVGD